MEHGLDPSSELNFAHFRPRRSAARVSDRIAHQIALELLDGQYPPGWRLPPERELMEQLDCSRLALRGALHLLESWGLLTVKIGREGGAVVRRPEPADMVDHLSVLMQHEGATASDVDAARRAIEPMIAEAAATNASAEHIAEMERCLAELSRADLTRAAYRAVLVEFKRSLGEAAGYVWMSYFLDALTLVTNRSISPKLPYDAQVREEAHKVMAGLVDAIRRRDPGAAHDVSLEACLATGAYWDEHLPGGRSMPIVSFDAGGLDASMLFADG